MVIHSNNDLTSSTSTQARQKASSSGSVPSTVTSKPAENASSNIDEVKLSQEAQTFERLESKIQNSSGVDTAKVDLIKQQIADGSYEINSSRIADSIIKQDDLLK